MVGTTIDPSSIVEKKEDTDSATAQDTTNSLQISYASQANANARESGKYTYSIVAPSNVSANQSIQV